MLNKPLSLVEEADLQALIASSAGESRTLEFKSQLPQGGDDVRREFLADATALANAQGGDIIFGLSEDHGTACALGGFERPALDDAVARLESLLQTGVDPRIVRPELRVVELSSGAFALVLRLPASHAAPHRVTLKGHGHFYIRRSNGKSQMDTAELRQAFLGSEQVASQFKTLHEGAVARAAGDEVAAPLSADLPFAVATVAPLDVFRAARDLPISREDALLPPIPTASTRAGSGGCSRFNF